MANTPVYGFDFESPDDLPGETLTGGQTGTHPILAEQVETELVRIESDVDDNAADIAALQVATTTSREPEIFTASGTWIDPNDGWLQIIVECVGPGGGGGGAGAAGSGQAAIAGPGGGGEYSRSVLTPADVGPSETVTVGTGGAGGVGSPTSGSAGSGPTSFGALVSANPGQGGSLQNASSVATRANGGVGGAGGTGQFQIRGGDGGNAYTVSGAYASDGGNGISHLSTTRRPASATSDATAGTDGTLYGGGGGGGKHRNGAAVTSRAGGTGADGVCIVTYIY